MQIAVHLVREKHKFEPLMKFFLGKNNLKYIDYVLAVVRGVVFADEFLIAAITDMWNVKISILSPAFSDVWDLYHNSPTADIYLISNGRYLHKEERPTHYTSTSSLMQGARKVGSDLSDVTIRKRSTYTDARLDSTKKTLLIKKEELLRKHYDVNNDLIVLADAIEMCKRNLKTVEENLSSCQITEAQVARYQRYMDNALSRQKVDKAVKVTPDELDKLLKDSDKERTDEEELIRGRKRKQQVQGNDILL